MRVSGSLGLAAVGPAVTGAPAASSTLMLERAGSGRSPKLIETWEGGVARLAPGPGLIAWGRE